MACKNVCRLCDNFIMSQSVNFTGGNLIIDLPAGSYADCRKVCIVVAQKIPDTTTINAPVFVDDNFVTALSNSDTNEQASS